MKQYHIISSVFESEKEARKILVDLNNASLFGKETEFMLMTVETQE